MSDQYTRLQEVVRQAPDPCPFCNGSGKVMERTGKRGAKLYFVQCFICGAQGAVSEMIPIAILNWNSRPSTQWVPLQENGPSYLLPAEQRYQHLMVHESGRITLLDYLEDDQVVSQVDVNLGSFRISTLRKREDLQ